MRLIDANKLIDAINKSWEPTQDSLDREGLYDIIKSMPTAKDYSKIIIKPDPILDIGEDGKQYQKENEKYDLVYKCKTCGDEIFLTNYCSNCSQKLR